MTSRHKARCKFQSILAMGWLPWRAWMYFQSLPSSSTFRPGVWPAWPIFNRTSHWFRRVQRGKTELRYFLVQLYRLRVESLLSNWIMLWIWWFYAAHYHLLTVSHCTQFCWPRLWHDLRCLIWTLFLYVFMMFYGSSWLGTTSSFRLGLSVLHGFLLTAIDIAVIWIQSLHQKQCKLGRTDTPDFWCVKHLNIIWTTFHNDPWFVSHGLRPTLKHQYVLIVPRREEDLGECREIILAAALVSCTGMKMCNRWDDVFGCGTYFEIYWC